MSHVRAAVVSNPVIPGWAAIEVIWPLSGILEIIHIMSKTSETQRIL
jgi:hypothetical protein